MSRPTVRTWTTSVVITLAAAGGCDKTETTGPTQNPPPVNPTGASGATAATAATGAIAPTGITAPTGTVDPEVSVNPPPAQEPELLTEVKNGNSTISVDADGTCREYISVDCPPDVMCNPPPPQDVPCPPELEPAAKVKKAEWEAERAAKQG